MNNHMKLNGIKKQRKKICIQFAKYSNPVCVIMVLEDDVSILHV